MTIDEAIDELKSIFSNYELDLPCTDSLDIESKIIVLLEELKLSRQELNELRKYSYVQGLSDGYNKAIDDFIEKVKLKYLGVHPDELYEKYYPREICKQIKEIAEQLKAGGENEQSI